MKRTLIAGIAAAALAATAFSAPPSAEAHPALLIPLIAAGVGGVVLGTAVASTNRPAGEVYVAPHAEAVCHIVRQKIPGGWRKVKVCD
jgi:hypothetical protein